MILEATGIELRVCEDIAARQAKGIEKYGTTLADNPASQLERLTHAYQEALDLAVYLKWEIERVEKQWQPPKKQPVEPGEGWRLLIAGETICSEDQHFMSGEWSGVTGAIGMQLSSFHAPIRRRVYRPFANAEEFKPHRDRWLLNPSNGTIRRVDHYSDTGVNGMSWSDVFRNRLFGDGTPCGVKT